jgi:AMP nucleosidase
VSVGRSKSEIPYPYVLDGSGTSARGGPPPSWRAFPTELVQSRRDRRRRFRTIGPSERPLSLFDGPRVDFSLARLRHYTGTPVEHTQRYVLFANYVRYVDEFVRMAVRG